MQTLLLLANEESCNRKEVVSCLLEKLVFASQHKHYSHHPFVLLHSQNVFPCWRLREKLFMEVCHASLWNVQCLIAAFHLCLFILKKDLLLLHCHYIQKF
jgi:hypothetical protein